MSFSEEQIFKFGKAKRALTEAERVVIISHRAPDGDAVGSNLALRGALEGMGKSVVSACVDPVPKYSLYLKDADKFVQDFNPNDFDAYVSVDCADRKLVKFLESKPELLNGEKPFINIDHHESNDEFGTVNVVDTKACAASFILFEFFKFWGVKINVDMANQLLHGIYFDTGALMHSNTSAEVYRVAGELMLRGANVQKTAKELFHTTDVNKLRLWGRILERAYVNDEGVTVSAVSRNDYEAVGANSKDTGGAIDYLNSVPNAKYSILLAEDEKGLVKASLRTNRGDVNLSEVASKWGGGGHPKASGFGVDGGTLKPVMSWKVVKEGGEEVAEF